MGCPQGGDGGTTVSRAPQSSSRGVSPAVPKVRIRGPRCPDTPGGVVVGWPLCVPKVGMGGPRCPDPPEPWPWGVPSCPQGKEEGTTVHRYPWRGGHGVAPMCPQGGEGGTTVSRSPQSHSHGVSPRWGWGNHGAQTPLEGWPWGVPRVGMGGPQCPGLPQAAAMGCPQGEDGVATVPRYPWRGGHGVSPSVPRWGWGDHTAQTPLH